MIRLKGTSIEADEVLLQLKKTRQLRQIFNSVLHQKIINQVAAEKEISATEEEVQAEADRIRYENRLFRASDTFAWLADQLISAEDWEAGIRDRLLSTKLAHSLFDQEVKKYFAEHRLNFDQVLLYRLVVPYEKLAQEICYQIQEGEISFYEAAHIYDVDSTRRCHCGFEGKVYRWSLNAALSPIVFSASPGAVVGPLTIDQASHLFLVEEHIPAELTPELHEEILQRLMNEWLMTELSYLLNSS
ncbi:peptidylprolyl isomerase [Leptolyngbya ohadii]|uniref:peptidylprolyl isomerase n=1 Tax=Leptolyngbya ohadii TaxID=1962290 RepID=UPI000B5A16A6|nr:peptidylprolyl isomerase [Leptolyngbya ohadii]